MQGARYDKTIDVTSKQLKDMVNDDLIFYVPIYDMLDRKYAAFSSFPEALRLRESDPKGYGIKYKDHNVQEGIDHLMLLYLFRLCGSGINYKPQSHGFGNFWISNMVLEGKYTYKEWLNSIPEAKFSDNKGYMLPQFTIGLRNFILQHSEDLVAYMYDAMLSRTTPMSIIELVDTGNAWMNNLGFNKTTFVLSAFAADVAEYYPKLIDQWSMIYAGTNARRCIRAIFGKSSQFDAIDFLSKRYNATPYSIEDSRLCDPVRYFLEYQSKYHIENNDGVIYKNNSILKKTWTLDEYQDFTLRLRG